MGLILLVSTCYTTPWWKENANFEYLDVSNPGSYEDVVELLVPELQKRGLMWDDYLVPGGTFRENLQNTPGQPHLGKDHPGYQYKWPPKTEESEVKATPEVAVESKKKVASVVAAENEVKSPEPIVEIKKEAVPIAAFESEVKSPETVVESEVKPTPLVVA